MELQDKTTDREEQDIARLLQAAGRREQLPGDLRLKWEDHFRGELTDVKIKRTRRQRRGMFAAAASLAVLAIGVTLLGLPPAPEPLHIQVSAVSGHNRLENAASDSNSLQRGTQLVPGQVIRTGPLGHVALAYDGYDLRLGRDTVLALEVDGVSLRRGKLYASDNMRGANKRQLEVRTPFGNIRDIGTQFTVSVLAGETVTTVRRGIVVLDAGDAHYRGEATPGSATQITINRQQEVRSERVAPSGQAWQWIYQAAPRYSLEGQSTLAFLQWSTAESGLRLAFASPGAEAYASVTTLHGDIRGMDPESAVAPVLATTDLSTEVVDGALRVSLKR
jgi:ferric-dicitrate binding protein FerR (iron transport regulator)